MNRKNSCRRISVLASQAVIALWILAACAQISPTDQSSLPGTWQLESFQSMDDSIGTIRPGKPDTFIMQINQEGSVAIRLECNRAMGSWTATPASSGTSGQFSFGPLATTKMLCPPPSLEPRILGQLGYVRSYLLEGGRLHLSLQADGGILTWKPIAKD